MKNEQNLSKRERQIMDIVFSTGKATVEEIRAQMLDAPSNSAARRMVSILVEKGFLQHEWEGPRYVYSPTADRYETGIHEAQRLTKTFFKGSPVDAVAAILDSSASDLSVDDLNALENLISKAREEGR